MQPSRIHVRLLIVAGVALLWIGAIFGRLGYLQLYRHGDYLIRALNADVSYQQLVREQIAGDLLEHPRINQQLGINESALGAAQYRFVIAPA